jgi:large subunit ribosomal protein L32
LFLFLALKFLFSVIVFRLSGLATQIDVIRLIRKPAYQTHRRFNIMPVPKQRVGHSDQGHRRANWKAVQPNLFYCSNCGSPASPHTVCGVCGFYKGKLISARFAKKSGYAAAQAAANENESA